MNEPLLSSLCTICHIDPPKYTCPRCTAQTCSLRCSKRHKLWASCNGIRDPTVFKPISEVATPAGIDHDYNFIHSIEAKIQRSEKVLIEDLGIVNEDELRRARNNIDEQEFQDSVGEDYVRGEVQIAKLVNDNRIKIIKAPKGMRRNVENTSIWNRKHRCMNWQVEWFRPPNGERTLYRISDKHTIGVAFDIMFEEERKLGLSSAEKTAERKRKAVERGVYPRKKGKIANSTMSKSTLLQNAKTGTWDMFPARIFQFHEHDSPPEKHHDFHFYLQRPFTPASYPKVLALLDTEKVMSEQLEDRDVMEFPTIHVLEEGPEDLPDAFMLEKEFLKKVGNLRRQDTDTEMSGMNEDEESDDDSSDSDEDTSQSPSEEGEISE